MAVAIKKPTNMVNTRDTVMAIVGMSKSVLYKGAMSAVSNRMMGIRTQRIIFLKRVISFYFFLSLTHSNLSKCYIIGLWW